MIKFILILLLGSVLLGGCAKEGNEGAVADDVTLTSTATPKITKSPETNKKDDSSVDITGGNSTFDYMSILGDTSEPLIQLKKEASAALIESELGGGYFIDCGTSYINKFGKVYWTYHLGLGIRKYGINGNISVGNGFYITEDKAVTFAGPGTDVNIIEVSESGDRFVFGVGQEGEDFLYTLFSYSVEDDKVSFIDKDVYYDGIVCSADCRNIMYRKDVVITDDSKRENKCNAYISRNGEIGVLFKENVIPYYIDNTGINPIYGVIESLESRDRVITFIGNANQYLNDIEFVCVSEGESEIALYGSNEVVVYTLNDGVYNPIHNCIAFELWFPNEADRAPMYCAGIYRLKSDTIDKMVTTSSTSIIGINLKTGIETKLDDFVSRSLKDGRILLDDTIVTYTRKELVIVDNVFTNPVMTEYELDSPNVLGYFKLVFGKYGIIYGARVDDGIVGRFGILDNGELVDIEIPGINNQYLLYNELVYHPETNSLIYYNESTGEIVSFDIAEKKCTTLLESDRNGGGRHQVYGDNDICIVHDGINVCDYILNDEGILVKIE